MTTTDTTIDSITNKVFRNVQEAFAALNNYRTCKDGDLVHVAEAYYELELAVARVEFLEAGSPECLDRQIHSSKTTGRQRYDRHSAARH
jgi:hypothetical protein